MSVYSAQALRPVSTYRGLCGLEITDSYITITAQENRGQIGGQDLGTWPLDCIRRFTSRPVGIFSFISGRRGPYGVQEYEFKMLEKDLFELNAIINRLTGTDLETFDAEPSKPDPPTGYTVFQRALSVDQMPRTPTDYSPTSSSDVDFYEISTSNVDHTNSFSRRRNSGSVHGSSPPSIPEQLYETMTNGEQTSSRPGSVYSSPRSTTDQLYETMTNGDQVPSRPGSLYSTPRATTDQYETMTLSDQIPSKPSNCSVYDAPRSTAKQHYEIMTNGNHTPSTPGSVYDTPRITDYETIDQTSSRPGSMYDTPRPTVKQHYEMMTNGDQTSSRPGSMYDTPRPTVKQQYETVTNDDHVRTSPVREPTYDVPRPTTLTNGDTSPVGHQIYDIPASRHCRLSISSLSPVTPSLSTPPNGEYINVAAEDNSPTTCIPAGKLSNPQSREHSYYENVKPASLGCACENSSPAGKHQRNVFSVQSLDSFSSVSLLNGDYVSVSVDSVVHPQYEQAGGHLTGGKQHHGYEWSNGDFRNTS